MLYGSRDQYPDCNRDLLPFFSPRPIILDPADPTNNLGRRNGWKLVAEEAANCLWQACCMTVDHSGRWDVQVPYYLLVRTHTNTHLDHGQLFPQHPEVPAQATYLGIAAWFLSIKSQASVHSSVRWAGNLPCSIVTSETESKNLLTSSWISPRVILSNSVGHLW